MSETPAEETAPITTASPKLAKERVFGIAVRAFAAVTVIGSVAAITQLSYSPPRAPIVGYQIVNRDGSIPEGAIPIPVPPPGLILGDYQGEPDPAFDEATGYSLASRVTQPTKFFNIEFGISTNKIDPQTQRELLAPTATVSGDSISADLSAWAASWNRQEFNQGAPKPKAKEQAQIPGEARAKQVWEFVAGRWVGHDSVDGESPKATGTYDKDTKKFTLDWTSLIVGGPFNSFTGVWHLEGVVRDR
ncbi:Uncharacterised protein [Mycobacteroides abscessus subsp. abscessus]|nr:hypothetical protein [Mycobacteroides abscessus]SIL61048.1 Uncharacterised protein [Mycobacteroides abscessus subsp. abscessus]